MKIFRITVSRPQKQGQDSWETQRSAIAVSESFDDATKKAIDYYNEVDGVDDYFVTGVNILASETEGEGEVLL